MDEELSKLEQLAALGDTSAKSQLIQKYRQLGKIQWFVFRDKNTCGIRKTAWKQIWIEALDEDEAVAIFKVKLGIDPYYWWCRDPFCCGTPDFMLEDLEDIEEPIDYDTLATAKPELFKARKGSAAYVDGYWRKALVIRREDI